MWRLGPDGDGAEALGRLEVIADTFLSMNAPVQLALPSWLAGRRGIQEQILARVRGNLAAAKAAGLEVLEMEAGWSAILRLEQRGGAEDLAMRAAAGGRGGGASGVVLWDGGGWPGGGEPDCAAGGFCRGSSAAE